MDVRKKRILIIVLFGVAAVGATLLLTDPAVSPFFAAGPPVAVAPATLPSPVVPAFPAAPAAPATAALPASPTPLAPPANIPVNGKTPVLPQGAMVAGQVLRDIFSPPAELSRLLPQQTRTVAPGSGPNGSVGAAAGAAPVLTGIISGASTRVAILRQGAISRSYRAGESAGAYRVSSIGPDSVKLVGPAGTIVLKMGQ